MPSPPKIQTELSDALRDELEQKIVANHFGGYKSLESWLAEKGYAISHAAIHRHGQAMKERLQRNVANATQATLILKECPKYDDGLLISATLALIQSEIFGLMNTIQNLDEEETDDPEKRAKMLKDLTMSIVNIGKATSSQKKFETEIRQQEREQALSAMAKSAKAEGVSDETILRIRTEVLGFTQ
jgi:hypothetical protein